MPFPQQGREQKCSVREAFYRLSNLAETEPEVCKLL